MSPVFRTTAVTSDAPSCERLSRPARLILLLISKSGAIDAIGRNAPLRNVSSPSSRRPAANANGVEMVRVARPRGDRLVLRTQFARGAAVGGNEVQSHGRAATRDPCAVGNQRSLRGPCWVERPFRQE